MLGAGEGMGRCIGPRPRAPAHVAIKMLGHPYAQEPALVARFTQEMSPVFDSGSEWACTIWSGAWKQSAAAAPASRCSITPAGKAGELVNDSDKQVRRAGDGCRQVVERGGLVGD